MKSKTLSLKGMAAQFAPPSNTRWFRTAYAVAFAKTDPAGAFQPQIEAVRIFSEGAHSLSYVGSNRVAFDVVEVRGDSYQEASDHAAFLLQTMPHYAWTKPLLDPRVPVMVKVTFRATSRAVQQEAFGLGLALAMMGCEPWKAASILAGESTLFLSKRGADRLLGYLSEAGLKTRPIITTDPYAASKKYQRRKKAKAA